MDGPQYITTRRQHNTQLRIHRIPTEILAMVLLFTIYGDDDLLHGGSTVTKKLRPLASVCHAWLEIVLTTPSLWTHVQCRHDTKVQDVERVLRLSAQAGIHVSIQCDPDKRFPDAVLRVLSENQSHRWRSLHLSQASVHVWRLCRTALQASRNLRSLQVDLVKSKGKELRAWVLPTLPELARLQTSCLFLSFPESHSKAFLLRHISISDVNLDRARVLSLLRTIGACGALETLELVNVYATLSLGYYSTDDSGDQTPFPEEILLPSLSEVVLRNCPAVLLPLLDTLRPGKSLTSVDLDDRGVDTAFWREYSDEIWVTTARAFNNPASLFRRAIDTNHHPTAGAESDQPMLHLESAGVTGVKIRAYSRHDGPPYFKLHIGLPFLFPSEANPLLSYQDAPAVRIIVGNGIYLEEDPMLLLNVPSAVELVMWTQRLEDGPRAWMASLADSGMPWKVPRLRKIILYIPQGRDCELVDAVAPMIEARRDASCQPGIEIVPVVPKVYRMVDSFRRYALDVE